MGRRSESEASVWRSFPAREARAQRCPRDDRGMSRGLRGHPDGAEGAERPRFPELPVRSLAGDELVLPRDLPAPLTLVVCAFRQWQQRLVDEWIDWAVAAGVPPSPLGLDPEASSTVIEVPVLGRRYRPARGFIDGGMAAGIRVPAVLARTLTAYADVSAFCRAAGIDSTATVAAMVVRRDGTVLSNVSGPPRAGVTDAVATALGLTG
jgi:hypothetical protein